ncbi:MAG: cytochrome b/b6 domain-containing protein [Acidobacteriota bacterium]
MVLRNGKKGLSLSIMKNLAFIITVIGIFIFLAPGELRAEMSDDDCLTCHGDKDLEGETERGKKLKLFVPENALMGSVHEDLSCTDCHIGAESFEEIPHSSKPLERACKNCHEEEAAETANDVHGKGCASGDEMTPSCCSCHGGHDIKPLNSPESRFSPENQPDTCGKCHGGDEISLKDHSIYKRNIVTRYKSSVHYQAVNEGKTAASCTDCHGSHNILPSGFKDSGVSRANEANSCMKCHKLEGLAFWDGPHGDALEHGNNDVPTCSTCHGDHDMASLRVRDGVAKQWAATQVCIWCHGNARMMARYGLDTTPVESYMQDFHGLTQRGTMGASATCADCHDPHHSLPSSHPNSRMHISNRGPTCGKCHGKVSDNFAMSFSHKKSIEVEGTKLESIIRIVYILLIIGVIGGMLIYTGMIWFKAVREKIKGQKKDPYIERMNNFGRTVHKTLLLSFIVLVITGFALKFPEAFWVKWLFSIGMTETVRAFIHRIAAIVMTIDSIIFTMYLLFRKRGKRLFKEFLPKMRDITDIFKFIKYYLGISQEKHAPKSDVFNFGEKVEFWAMVWGTVIMTISGLILWFPKIIPATWCACIIPIARVFHYYEAILAALAILVWHGFHVILHPDEYPMNTSWWTGHLTKKESEHRFEEDAIKKQKIED